MALMFKRLGEFDELGARSIGSPNEHGDLDADPRGAASSGGIHTGFLINLLV